MPVANSYSKQNFPTTYSKLPFIGVRHSTSISYNTNNSLHHLQQGSPSTDMPYSLGTDSPYSFFNTTTNKPQVCGILNLIHVSCGRTSLPPTKHRADRPSALLTRKPRHDLPHGGVPYPDHGLDRPGFQETVEGVPERHVRRGRDGAGILHAGG